MKKLLLLIPSLLFVNYNQAEMAPILTENPVPAPSKALSKQVPLKVQKSAQTKEQKPQNITQNTQNITMEQVNKEISNWMAKPKKSAQKMIKKYGLPQECTSKRLIWHNNGPWKRTEVINEMLPHNFPIPHHDRTLQAVNYDLAAKKYNPNLDKAVSDDTYSKITLFDGSTLYDRTKGELIARCHKEPMNFISINLAHEIITGQKTVDQARQDFKNIAMKFMKFMKENKKLKKENKQKKPLPKKVAKYTQGFIFMPANTNQGDPGVALKQMPPKRVAFKNPVSGQVPESVQSKVNKTQPAKLLAKKV